MAALFLRSFFKFLSKRAAERKPLAIYDCADVISKPEGKPNWPGTLTHGKGRCVGDLDATNKRAWKYTPEIAEEALEHTIYGPYVNDFGKPGFYKISFRIRGEGFANSEQPIAILDVIQRPQFQVQNIVVLGQRVVRSKELSSEYKDFDVYCYAAGSGTYEYRCYVIPESFEQRICTLLFDNIRIYIHIPTWELI